jgi:hypothetical protein
MTIKDQTYYDGLEAAYDELCDALRPLAKLVDVPAGQPMIEAIPLAIALIGNPDRIISHAAYTMTVEQARELGFLPPTGEGAE